MIKIRLFADYSEECFYTKEIENGLPVPHKGEMFDTDDGLWRIKDVEMFYFNGDAIVDYLVEEVK